MAQSMGTNSTEINDFAHILALNAIVYWTSTCDEEVVEDTEMRKLVKVDKLYIGAGSDVFLKRLPSLDVKSMK